MHSQHEELSATHSTASHASEISRLDTQKFRTAKAASDAEMEVERLSQQLADLQARLQELEAQGDEGEVLSGADNDGAGGGGATIDDEVLLRLKVYRSLGIDVERDENDGVGDVGGAGGGGGGGLADGPGAGEFTKAVIRNDRRGDVHVVNIDKKFSRFFYANYFWQTL